MRIVAPDKEFKFRKLCPYCKGNMTYVATGWEEDENRFPRKLKKQLKKKNQWPLWIATDFDGDCQNEPDIEADTDEWEEWFRSHSDMPYVYQLPVDMQVESFIKKRFRFYL